MTGLKKYQLSNVNWNLEDVELNFQLNDLLHDAKVVKLDNSKGYIKSWINQSMYDFKRDATKQELEGGEIFGGLPLKDKRRFNKKTYGVSNSRFIGFMDDITPVRIKARQDERFSSPVHAVWFRFDTGFIDLNKSKCLNGAPDQKGYCAYDLPTAEKLFSWFAITKSLNGRYPGWANQYDIWPPNISPEFENYWYELCFAFVLAENRCVVTKFEKDNPVEEAPEVFVDNPLCPTNPESFWSTTLAESVDSLDKTNAARLLADTIKELYRYWNFNYCKAQHIENVGLHNEPYFKYFDYPDFLSPYSGLIQIRKYAELEGLHDLLSRFEEVAECTKRVKEELYRLLTTEFKYFE
jgi:hypothetical protein